MKNKAPRNKTISLSPAEKKLYKKELISLTQNHSINKLINKIIHADIFEVLDYLPSACVDLIIVDPPYNMNKKFNTTKYNKKTNQEYELWLDKWLGKIAKLLKANATIYICGDWYSSSAIYRVAQKYFKVRNRITWEREKGRGAKNNWKNCSEDIWFCTVSDNYYFNVEAVKLKRKVIAPYTNPDGKPRDWANTNNGKLRITHPSNLWSDITIPFWSMAENTTHPTQKPEKLIAKLILASSRQGDIVFDPFLGSGTTAVVAKKLQRNYCGVEIDLDYCCLAAKRLEQANYKQSIQGYSDGYFWERNSKPQQPNKENKNTPASSANKIPQLKFNNKNGK